MVIEILFFSFILIVFHSYILYPFFIRVIEKPFEKKSFPVNIKVSVLIAAYNEEKVIEDRINNILNSDYDKNNIEILVGSDNSNDKTNEILARMDKEVSNLKIFLYNERNGKAGILNKISKEASNEILVFTDANTVFNKSAIKELISGFADKTVGGVCGRLILLNNLVQQDDAVKEKSYWDYETKIKKAEGSRGILIGANGGIFAIRKNLFREIPIKRAVTDDFFLSLAVLVEGYKFIYNYFAEATETVGKTVMEEYKRKVRFSATNFQTIFFFKKLLFHKKFLLSFAFWSHKILRWMIPLLMVLTFVLNIILLGNHLIYNWFFISQIVLYLSAFLGWIFHVQKIRINIFSIPFFFVIANIAVLHGFIQFITKKHSVIWQSTQR